MIISNYGIQVTLNSLHLEQENYKLSTKYK